MSAFTAQDRPGQPTWTIVTAESTDFTPLSATGQTVTVQYGFGLGGFGAGGFGVGEGVTIVTQYGTVWTSFTTR